MKILNSILESINLNLWLLCIIGMKIKNVGRKNEKTVDELPIELLEEGIYTF